MSDISGAGAPPADAAPAEGGQGEITETPTPTYFDPSGVQDHLVKLKVGDSEQEVSVREALSGYQRQADYTRKTQELAAQRQELQAAQVLFEQLRSDPQGTLSVLQQQLLADAAEGQDPYGDDPMARELAEVRTALDEIKIERTLGRLQAKYGEFDSRAVIQQAVRMQSTDLETAYKVWAYEKFAMEQAARTDAEQESARLAADRDAAINASKAQVGSTVAGGSTVLGGGVPISTEPLSLRDHIANAVKASR